MAKTILVLFLVSIMRVTYSVHLRLHNAIGKILGTRGKSCISPLNLTYFPFVNQNILLSTYYSRML